MTVTRSDAGGTPDAWSPDPQPDPLRWQAAAGSESALVGRELEVARIGRRLTEARQMRGSIVALSGEAGIGKTRLARAVAEIATRSGFTILWTRAFEGDWQPPYQTWIDIVLQGIPALPAPVPGQPTPPWVAALLPLVPELHHHYPGVEPARRLSPSEERFRLVDGLGRCLRDIARANPLLLVLDDVQWCDPESLQLLRNLAGLPRELPLVLMPLLRDDYLGQSTPLAQLLAQLRREDRFEEIRLRGLSGDEVHRLIDGIAPLQVAADQIGPISDGTRGNPFFVEEVVRFLIDEGRLSAETEPAHPHGRSGLIVPESLRLVVDHRLARLSPATQRMLRLAAVCTDGFDFDILSSLTGLGDETLLEAIDEALAARLIAPVDAATERYDFPHALIRSALYDSWSPSRRARLHRQLAVSLEQIHALRPDLRAAELAAHYQISASLPGAERGVPHALTAARTAERSSAPDQAVNYLRIARDLSANLPGAERAAILAELAIAEANTFGLGASLRTIDQTLRLMEEIASPPGEVARFLAAVVTGLHDGGAAAGEWMPLVRRGLAIVPPEDAITRARLTLMIPRWEPVVSGVVNASRWLGSDPEAVAVARASGDEDLFARSMQPWDLHDREITESLAGLAGGWQRPEAIIRALTVCGAFWLYYNGDLHRARMHFEHLRTVADRYGSVHGNADANARLTLIHLALGDLPAARRMIATTRTLILRLGADHHLHASLWWLTALLAEFDDGSWEGVAGYFVPFVTDPSVATRTTAIDDAALAALALVRMGQPDRARELLLPLAEILGRLEPTMWLVNGAVGFGGTAVWEIGATDLAPAFLDAARGLIAAGHGDFPGSSSHLTVARMASLLGDHPAATVAFAEARSHLERTGQRPLRATVDLDEATALSRRRGSDPAATIRLARSAAERFEALGMGRWADRARSLTTGVPRGTGDSPTAAAGLTSREVEVVRLVARGFSDRQIADDLFVSPRTVHAHLRNILAKTELVNRTELSIWAHEHGLAGRDAPTGN